MMREKEWQFRKKEREYEDTLKAYEIKLQEKKEKEKVSWRLFLLHLELSGSD